jgi:hypothetical protein
MEALLRAMDISVKTAENRATSPDSNPEADAIMMWDGAGTVDSGCRRAGGRSCDTEARPIRKRISLFLSAFPMSVPSLSWYSDQHHFLSSIKKRGVSFSYRNVGGLLWEAEAAEKLLHSEGVVPVVGRAGEERLDLVLRKKNATVVSFP